MQLLKKKDLRWGEEVVFIPGLHWIKIAGPLCLLLLAAFLFFLEFFTQIFTQAVSHSLYSGVPSPASCILLGLAAVGVLYFLIKILEYMHLEFLAANKIAVAALIVLPLLGAEILFGITDNLYAFIYAANIPLILLIFLILSLLHLGAQIFEYTGIEYALTNQRVLIKQGIFSERIIDIPIEKIESVISIQGIWGSALGYGSVYAAGTGGRFPLFSAVEKPAALRRALNTVIQKNRAVTILRKPGPPPEALASLPVMDGRELLSYGTLVTLLEPPETTGN